MIHLWPSETLASSARCHIRYTFSLQQCIRTSLSLSSLLHLPSGTYLGAFNIKEIDINKIQSILCRVLSVPIMQSLTQVITKPANNLVGQTHPADPNMENSRSLAAARYCVTGAHQEWGNNIVQSV